jgi:hypothetical protein
MMHEPEFAGKNSPPSTIQRPSTSAPPTVSRQMASPPAVAPTGVAVPIVRWPSGATWMSMAPRSSCQKLGPNFGPDGVK